MAIRTVVTRGYGNGTFNGTIALVVTHGYAIAVVTTITVKPPSSAVPVISLCIVTPVASINSVVV